MDQETLLTVRQLPLFAALADDQLDCIAPGEVIQLEAGQILLKAGDAPEFFFVTIEGEISVVKTYDRQEVVLGTSKPGMFMGEIPLFLEIPWLATARASKQSRLFRLGKADFWRMLSTCHSVAREIFKTAATRVRNLEGYSQQREKLISLGNMAAGLAHELNNPASAARRASTHLQQSVTQAQRYVCSLSKMLKPSDWKHLGDALQEALSFAAKAAPLSSVTRSDREEALATWLEQQKISEGWKLAPPLANAGLDPSWFEDFIAMLPTGSAQDAVGWLESNLMLKSLTGELQQSTARISELVKAVKAYSYMDQPAKQEVDIHEGIENTLTVLGHKLKGITVTRVFDRTLPRIMAHGGELNQVWTNLIDNAVGALNGSGTITISTTVDGDHIVVEIADDGSGIPAEIQSRIFEPFFTTKGVGTGTGLGLIICQRIVADRHGGEIEFESTPGNTRFKVRLPIRGPERTSQSVISGTAGGLK